ncbi:conserved virulence factor C family protein [Paenibacillus sp. HJGM_3]|uniref:conserved virulence factor C family protein n=1 Tax=Paenibacillus sp. HJGM_3 TaxID=3379816 RepID=UPI00385C1627
MRIVSIEPTPSPNSMKINVDEALPKGDKRTYDKSNRSSAPAAIQQLLDIPGVTSVFRTADFLAIDRNPKGDWQAILAKTQEILGTVGGGPSSTSNVAAAGGVGSAGEADAHAAFGEAQVYIQMFRGIPMQIRVKSGLEEFRTALSSRFTDAAIQAGTASPNLIRERTLKDAGVRYGELPEIAEQVAAELDASYDDARLQELVRKSLETGVGGEQTPEELKELSASELAARMAHDDWKVRYAALQRVKPALTTMPLLVQALRDPQASIRRLATVYLGDIREPQALPYLFEALKDSSVSVRRTAGDTLSDLGDPAAIPPMIEALGDPNKLVRWRAARFLYEAGDATAIRALKAAVDDAEFEVRLQAQLALARIEGGDAAAGSVWQQMTRRGE